MEQSINYGFGRDASSSDYMSLAKILNDGWGEINQINGDFSETTPEMLKERFNTDSIFLIQYDKPTDEDTKLISIIDESIPIALLETMGINAASYSDVPNIYSDLVGNGTWKPEPDNPDTLILVDITLLKSRQGRKGNGEGNLLVQYALNYLALQTNYDKVWTFTPDIEGVKRWHMKNGAIDTEFVIKDARPNYTPANVNLMDYSNRIMELRN